MTDKKSKLPDMQELGNFTSKLFKDIKHSVTEIISDYKKNRQDSGGGETDIEGRREHQPHEPTVETPKASDKAQVTDEKPSARPIKSDTVKPKPKAKVMNDKKEPK